MDRFENEALYELLRMAGDEGNSPCCLSHRLDSNEWEKLHSECLRQFITGVVYRGVCRLPRDQQPPIELAFQWASEVETIKGQNKLLNAEAARLTELFAAQGRKTAVLKGPANALLYPDSYMRQVGDIDLWVDGGRDSVCTLLKKMGYQISETDFDVFHHFHLYPTNNDISVEVHFRPSFGTWNPFTKKRILCFLEEEIQKVERVDEGFYVPSIKFALAMQLTHIMHHFIGEGVGAKQIVDYYILLKHSSEDDRREITAKLSSFGLLKICGALMWILGNVFGLDRSKMLCEPDEKHGKEMLAVIHEGGNFGYYAQNLLNESSMNMAVRCLKHRWRNIRKFWFAPMDVFCCELDYWGSFIKSIPLRIKLRKFSLWNVYHAK